MATKISKLTFGELSGGQDSKTSPLFLRNNECELIQNYHLDNVGSLTKRNGIVYLIGQIVDAVSILGMYFFKDAQGTDYSNVLVACNDGASPTNSDIYKVSSNAWTKSKQDDTSSSLPVITTFIDYVFRTNGTEVMNSSADLVHPWGTTNCLATLKPKYCCVWEDRLYWLNDNSSTKYPSRIGWSELPTGTPLALTFGANNWADINPDDNDEITWGEPFGRRMLIFKNKALYNWTFGQVEPDRIIDVGTPQGRTVKQTQGICFFANEYGVYAYTGEAQPILISKKVQPFIDAISVPITLGSSTTQFDITNPTATTFRYTYDGTGTDPLISIDTIQIGTTIILSAQNFTAGNNGTFTITGVGTNYLEVTNAAGVVESNKTIGTGSIIVYPDFTNMRAEVDNDHYYLYIGDVIVKGEKYNNIMLVYTISAKAWHIETYPFEIKAMARFGKKTLSTTTAIYDSIYLGDNDGFVYRKGTGTSDYLGTTAKPISGRIVTKEYPLSNFPDYSNLDNLDFFAQKGSGSKVNFRIDKGDWQSWKDLQKRITSGKITGKARTLQFSITDNSTNTSQIEGFSIKILQEQSLRRDKDE